MNLSHFTAAERNAIRDAVELVCSTNETYNHFSEPFAPEDIVLLRNSVMHKLASEFDPLLVYEELAFIHHCLKVYLTPPVLLKFQIDPASTTAASLACNKIERLANL